MGYQYQLSVQAFLPSGLVHACAPSVATLLRRQRERRAR
jgi:hypothetical protein